MRPELDDNLRGLERLAQLLRWRFRRTTGRSFVLLAADVQHLLPANNEHMETQRLPTLLVVPG